MPIHGLSGARETLRRWKPVARGDLGDPDFRNLDQLVLQLAGR